MKTNTLLVNPANVSANPPTQTNAQRCKARRPGNWSFGLGDLLSYRQAQAKRRRKHLRNLEMVKRGGMQSAGKWGGRWFALAA